jgi:hypothetical protein
MFLKKKKHEFNESPLEPMAKGPYDNCETQHEINH